MTMPGIAATAAGVAAALGAGPDAMLQVAQAAGGARKVGPAQESSGGLLDAISDLAGAVQTAASGVVGVGGLAAQLAKLALPSNVVRAAAGGLGVILIFAGVLILGREVKS